MNIERIAILGSGSMGTAILSGLLRAGFEPAKVSVSTNSNASAQKLADELSVNSFALESDLAANAKTVADADVVLVAVKPAYVIQVLEQVREHLRPDALVISVAAGITNESMQNALPESVAVIRSMPNTPAIVGRAVTGLARGSRASEQHLALAVSLFETVGKVLVVAESQIDALSTVSGSGPAYVFYLIEQFALAAVELGFTVEQAQLMVNETFLGASELLVASGKTPQELRRQVTSPNGTTMQAIAKLESAHLAQLFEAATQAALARAREIAAGK
jgi:pyrroline-5-carboxylate reductase